MPRPPGQPLLTAAAALLAAAAAAGPTRQSVDERTGVDAWDWADRGVSLRLVQRLPDQTRAFFLGRGFPRAAADAVASRCVLQTILRNTGDVAIHVDLHAWRIATDDGGRRPLRLKRQWQEQWETMGLAQAPRIAFQWALFPTEQRFAPGDWNMGMTTYPVPPDTRFDLHFTWRDDDGTHTGVVEGVHCAPDVGANDYRSEHQ